MKKPSVYFIWPFATDANFIGSVESRILLIRDSVLQKLASALSIPFLRMTYNNVLYYNMGNLNSIVLGWRIIMNQMKL